MQEAKYTLTLTLLLTACGGSEPQSTTTSSGGAGGSTNTTTTSLTTTSSSTTTSTNTGGAASCADIPPPVFALATGSIGDDPYSIALDPAGRSAITGTFDYVSDFGVGPMSPANEDAFVVVYDPAGKALWARQFGAAGHKVAGRQAAFDGGGNLLVAGTSNDITDFGGGPRCAPAYGAGQVFLVKLDPSGQHLYSSCFGAPSGQFEDLALAVDGAGNALVAARFTGTVDIGGVNLTAPITGAYAVTKLSPSGSVLWVRAFGAGTASSTHLAGIAVAEDGGVLLTGDLEGSIDFGAGVLAVKPGDVTGAFLVKLAPTGAAVWSKLFSVSLDVIAGAVSVGPGDRVALSGVMRGDTTFGSGPIHAKGPYNLFLATFEADGVPRWSKLMGEDADNSYGVHWGPDDVITTWSAGGKVDLGCGGTKFPPPFGSGAAMVRWSADGAPLAQRLLGGVTPTGVGARNGRVAVTSKLFPMMPPDLGTGPVEDFRGVLVAVWEP